jgi:hypothetical protein
MKSVMIAIDAYKGDNWKTVEKDIKSDLKRLGIRSQVLIRNHRYRVRFNSENDLHLAMLAGVFECLGAGGRMFCGMERYRYVKQN